MNIDKSIYSALEKVLHIERLLKEKLGRLPTLDELSAECGFEPAQINKILIAADGFGCSWYPLLPDNLYFLQGYPFEVRDVIHSQYTRLGGGYMDNAERLASSYRAEKEPNYGSGTYGFRIALKKTIETQWTSARTCPVQTATVSSAC